MVDEQHVAADHIATDKARAGSTPHIVRYVLFISLGLAVLGMAFLLLVE